jgi:hypothetical protein
VKSTLPIALFSALLLLLGNVGGVPLQGEQTLSARGILRYPRNIWWGICVVDTAFQPWGSYFTDTQINLMKSAGATGIRIMLDRNPWINNDTSNILGVQYRDYIKELREWCSPQIKVMLDLAMDGSDFNSTKKIQMMINPSLRLDWIKFGCDAVSHCHPDAICILDEPCNEADVDTGSITEEQYRLFVEESIEAYRSIDPEITVFVFGVPFKYLFMFHDDPLPYENVVYALNFPYYAGPDSDAADLYYRGLLEEGRAALYRNLDWKFGIMKGRDSLCLTAGVREYKPDNWDALMRDVYEYCKANGIHFLQFAFSKWKWSLLNTDYGSFNEIGRLWADNCAAI